MPPHPRKPVPSVSPVGEPDGSPFRYGGFRAASCAHDKNHIREDASHGSPLRFPSDPALILA